MFKLSAGDLVRGLVMAILAPVMLAVFAVLNRVVTDPAFDVFSLDFVALFKELTNVFIIAAYVGGSSYLVKNLLTSDDGKFLKVL